ncbi:hypothetical protein DW322_07750 [Rhodococcus rhodnii]|nr:hypothetical protein [Rhodococcus rhodnii]TXG90133.1 hypothetical protein DW322_07750 [Rhodococcus rhodnii]
MSTLGQRLDLLFAAAHRLGDTPPSESDVAAAVTAAGGVPVTEQEVAALRNGATHADPALLTRVAAHFGCAPEYLIDGDADLEVQLRFQIAVRNAGVRHLSLRSLAERQDLSVADMRSWLTVLEQLPPH